jgi:hypothetical protein
VSRQELHWSLGSKQVSVAAGMNQVQIVTINLLNQQPIRFNMAVAMMLPIATQRVISKEEKRRLCSSAR